MRGGGVEGRLGFFQKFIRFGSATLPKVWCRNQTTIMHRYINSNIDRSVCFSNRPEFSFEIDTTIPTIQKEEQ